MTPGGPASAAACPACGHPVTTADARCPNCGRPVPAPGDPTRRDGDPPPAADTLTYPAPAGPDTPTLAAGGPAHAGPVIAADAIPGYAILAELGRGGMGVVYRARETSLNRLVALKVLLAGAHGGPAAVARFRTEAEAAAAVQHRHIVHVFAVGEHRGLPYLAMELVPGGSLAGRLEGGPLPPAEAARVVEAVARGVQAAHERGVLHRDLKPANVLFTAEGEPKLADFGLAKLGDSGLTASGAVMGTPAYMAPEQARGDTKRIGPATDVWALGAVLYECLTGRPPFRGRSAPETFRLVCEADPEPLPAAVPRDLRTIARKCLEKDPAKRYPSASALADDLAWFRAGEPISARPPGPTVRAARWVGRHRGPVYLAAGVLLAAVVSVILLSLKPKPVPPPGPGPEPAGTGLPADLALIPPDAVAFATLRVDDLRRHPELLNLAASLTNAPNPPPARAIEEMVAKATGVRPADMERVTLVFGADEAGAGTFVTRLLIIVRTTPPADPKAVRDALGEMVGNFEPRDHRGRRYHAAKWGDIPVGLFKAGEHELVFGTPAAVDAVIDRLAAGPAAGPALPGLDEAARGHTLVVGARSAAESLTQVIVGPPGAAELPPELARAVEPFRGAETAVTLDLHPPAGGCPLPGADVAARLRFPTAGEAARAADGLQGLIREHGKPDPRPITAGPAVLLPALLKAVREADVRQEGTEVVVTGGPRWTAADWAAADRKPVPTTEEKLHRIGVALHIYGDQHGHFPPAVVRAEGGRPLRSWRVELLPLLDQEKLYRRLNLKETWDHPDNKALLDAVPDVFATAADDPAHAAGGTRFQALVGPGGVFDPTARVGWTGIPDGTSNTVLLVEAGDPVPWAAPRDVEYKPGGSVPKLGLPGADTLLLLIADGSTKRVRRAALRPAELSALFTRGGGETIDWAGLERGRKGK